AAPCIRGNRSHPAASVPRLLARPNRRAPREARPSCPDERPCRRSRRGSRSSWLPPPSARSALGDQEIEKIVRQIDLLVRDLQRRRERDDVLVVAADVEHEP